MDPFIETKSFFHELHTQMLSSAQGLLQTQLKPKYAARLERHLSEGSVWDADPGSISLDRKEPDLTVTTDVPSVGPESTAVLAVPSAQATEEMDPDELQLRRQRRIVIYVRERPRSAVAAIELLSPSNKLAGSVGQARYLEKRSSALRGGLHWIEIDLLRGGQRMPMPVAVPEAADYLAYVAQATPTGWKHLLYTWGIREALPLLGVPLLGTDRATLDLGACFREAYERTAADDEADYAANPPPPPLRPDDAAWLDTLLRDKGLRAPRPAP
jgi:hypothetical protein